MKATDTGAKMQMKKLKSGHPLADAEEGSTLRETPQETRKTTIRCNGHLLLNITRGVEKTTIKTRSSGHLQETNSATTMITAKTERLTTRESNGARAGAHLQTSLTGERLRCQLCSLARAN